MSTRTVPPRTVTITYEDTVPLPLFSNTEREHNPRMRHVVRCKACGYTYPAAVKVDAAEKAGYHRRACPSLTTLEEAAP